VTLTQASSRSGTTTLKVSDVLDERPSISELREAAFGALRRGEYGRAFAYQSVIFRRLAEARESGGVEA
jgi:hypothetical protein